MVRKPWGLEDLGRLGLGVASEDWGQAFSLALPLLGYVNLDGVFASLGLQSPHL